MKVARLVAATVAAILVSAVAGLACKQSSGTPSASGAAPTPSVIPPPPTLSAPPPSAAIPPLSLSAPIEDERNTIAVFRETAASSVFITQRQLVVVDPWQGRATEVPAGSGSGFVWDTEGHVVTNFHVVAGVARGGSLTVTLHDQSTLPAEIRGVEPRKDIAVLKVRAPAEKLVPIRLHEKNFRLEVGQKAIAIGNPFGLDHTLTVGVVSAVGRTVDGAGGVTIRDMVQTDAAINPGNSGGPLLDSGGRLIGMNTAIYSKSGVSAGVGFAVPASTIQRVVPQIIRTGHAEQVGIGIGIDPNGELERRARVSGVIVREVHPGTPAERAGLQGIRRTPRGLLLGDVLVGIDEHKVNHYDDLYNTLDRYQAGQRVTLKVLRGDKVIDVAVELAKIE